VAANGYITTPNITSNGSVVGTGFLAPPTNTHTAVPGLSTSVSITNAGQVLLVWLQINTTPSGNTIACTLTVDGGEQSLQIENSGSNAETGAMPYLITGLSVASHTLAANCWSSSSVGNVNGTQSDIVWQLNHP